MRVASEVKQTTMSRRSQRVSSGHVVAVVVVVGASRSILSFFSSVPTYFVIARSIPSPI